MKRIWAWILLEQVLCAVREQVQNTVGLSDTLAHLYNGVKKGSEWSLKNGLSGSVVNFKQKNIAHDEWSFEITVQEPELAYPEFAGIYLWYTDEQIKHGPYKGAEGKFSGTMAGLEFLGKSWDIVVATNHGVHDYHGLRSEDTEIKDSPDPGIMKGQKEITFKVIATSKNFKIEIYGHNGNLLYDKVRYTEMSEIGARLSGKFFGISTEYHSVGGAKSIVLKGVKFSSREESEEYDPKRSNVEVPEYKPRVSHEVEHPNEEIQHTIAVIEHLTKYLRVVLGEPQSKPVADNVVYLKKTLNFQSAHILEVRDSLRAIAEIGKRHEENEERNREELLRLIEQLHSRIARGPEERTAPKISLLSLAVLCLLSAAGGYFISTRMHYARKTSLH